MAWRARRRRTSHRRAAVTCGPRSLVLSMSARGCATQAVRPMRSGRTDRCPHATAPTRYWPTWVGPSTVGLRPIYLDDDLYAGQPLCEVVQATGRQLHLRVQAVKPQDTGRIPARCGAARDLLDRAGRGSGKCHHRIPVDGRPVPAQRCRHVPGHLAGGRGRQAWRQGTYRNGFITDLNVTPRNITETAACGHARWKIGIADSAFEALTGRIMKPIISWCPFEKGR